MQLSTKKSLIRKNTELKNGMSCGYFSIGSSMLLCFYAHLKILIDAGG